MADTVLLNQDLGMLRIGVCAPALRIADVDFNITAISEFVHKAAAQKIQLLLLPEMAVTGYTIGDLVQQQVLLTKTEEGLAHLLEEIRDVGMVTVLGMPLSVEQKIFNCAVIINAGQVLGVIPKTFLPNYREFYEERWFTSGSKAAAKTVSLAGKEVSFGSDILFQFKNIPAAIVGVEICEDLWLPISPHANQALAGATVLLNLSASNEVLGKPEWRKTMVVSESGRCQAAYCYCSSGSGESSNDIVYSGHAIIAENGTVLQESTGLSASPQYLVSDIDLDRLIHDRRQTTTFACGNFGAFRVIETEVPDVPVKKKLNRALDAHPFVPADNSRRTERCRDIFAMQVAGLAQKLAGSKINRTVIGVSGGLDSALALLVCTRTMDFLNLPRQNVHAFTLPGFGTTERTRQNATELCNTLGVTFQQIDIRKSAEQHLVDLGHSGGEDVVFENVQARYRTELLFNKANQLNAILIGTGDLTEVALGWSTFSGDQLSHYHVNCSVPKTLVRYLISWVADEEMVDTAARNILKDILETPISPELLRTRQPSEETIGPVELADFYLYPFIRFGIRPGKILYLAEILRQQGMFDNSYSLAELHRWFRNFILRFFINQFKRTCFPEGPKVGSVSLSPRGDWRMPSDGVPALWLDDIDRMYRNLSR